MKRCCRCKEVKPATDFHRNRSAPDGLQGACKPCTNARNRQWAHDNVEKRRAAAKRRYRRMAAAGLRTCEIAPPIKRRARRAVEKAIESGKLVRPDRCSSCGTQDFPIQAHHPDYEKPLSIIWLCTPCHGLLHARERAAA